MPVIACNEPTKFSSETELLWAQRAKIRKKLHKLTAALMRVEKALAGKGKTEVRS